MRTSRVTGSPVRSYGSMRKPVDSGATFSFEHNDQHALDQFAQQYEKKKKKRQHHQQFNGNVQSNKGHKYIKGLFFSTNSVMEVRNDMIRMSYVMNYISYHKTIHRTYKDSI